MNGERIKERLKIGGVWKAECYRDGKLIWTEEMHNIWTDEGLDALLDIMFHASTQIDAWFCVLSETNTTPIATHTYAVPGYTECVAYDEGTRPAYNEAASSSQSITNSANKAVFTMNATKTIYGAALVGGGTAADTKGDTAGGGTLSVSGLFATERAVIDEDVINLTYTVNADDDAA